MSNGFQGEFNGYLDVSLLTTSKVFCLYKHKLV